MKIGIIPENIFERIALWLGLAPIPLVDTQMAFLKAKAIMVATKGQLFECLSDGPLKACEVADRAKAHPLATEKLLNTLVHLDYLKKKGAHYSLSSLSRKWMLKKSPRSLYHKIQFLSVEWDMLRHYDHYLRTGEPIDIHGSFNSRQWQMYQLAMKDIARVVSAEIVRSTPVPKTASRLLDIGGAHGYYSKAFCEEYEDLHALVIDLPEALACTHALSSTDNATAKVQYRAGNVVTDCLGKEEWDLILMANIVHHFDDETNRLIACKVKQALRPGGFYIILDFVKENEPQQGDHIGGLLDLYFSLVSDGGIFRIKDMIQWQKDADLMPMKTIWLRTVPGHVLQIGVKR
jgi:2-polyprenyl-3-methyl-5-hydroxy-6-metoxy-1,4-benzoquinol methylase